MNCSSSSDPRNRNIAASFPGQCVAAGRKPTSSKSPASMSRAGGITESTRSKVCPREGTAKPEEGSKKGDRDKEE